MSASHAMADAVTMVRRNLVHVRYYPTVPLYVAGIPVLFLLLFVHVLGGTLGAGLGGGRADYVEYIVPGVLMFAIAGGAQGAAISVATDLAEGIVARFRSMAISRGAVLTGHVVGNLLQSLAALVLVVAVALAVGFRPQGSPLRWLAAFGVLALLALALMWLAVAMGTAARNVESASNLPAFLMLLPFLGSGFVPAESMSGPLRWFAEMQPFTHAIETIRALLLDLPLDGVALAATLAWSVALAVGGYVWARRIYERRSVR